VPSVVALKFHLSAEAFEEVQKMDLIERTSALEIVRRTSGDYAAAFAEIGRLPTVNAAPVRHGYWELITTGYGTKQYRCSQCKDDEYWKRRFCYGDEHFCPNCGALMCQERLDEDEFDDIKVDHAALFVCKDVASTMDKNNKMFWIYLTVICVIFFACLCVNSALVIFWAFGLL
jgi:hypothetical protein